MFLSEIKALIYLNQDLTNNITAYYLIKMEFCCLYYCFGYLLVRRFHKILERAGYKPTSKSSSVSLSITNNTKLIGKPLVDSSLP
jgi:hypothetical protein